jgi:hypothetical protein
MMAPLSTWRARFGLGHSLTEHRIIPNPISVAPDRSGGHRQIGALAHVAPVQLDPATEEVGAVFY